MGYRAVGCLVTLILSLLAVPLAAETPPLTAAEEAEREAAMDRCEPWSVRIGDYVLQVIYEESPDLRREWPG
jgi:hypothetical protein